MAEKELPGSYPVAYVLFVIAFLVTLMFLGPSAHKPKIIKSKKQPKNQRAKSDLRKKQKKQKKNAAADTMAVFDIKGEPKKLKRLTDKEYFAQIMSDYQQQVYSKLERPKDRTDLVIRYYKKEKDLNKVDKLRSLGFYIHERPPDEKYADLASNAIFYGDSTTRSDIEIIAYTLVKSGFELQSISPSIYSDTWKSHSVEIGTDTTKLNAKSYTFSDIRKKWGKE